MTAMEHAIFALERMHYARNKSKEERSQFWKRFWRASAAHWAAQSIEWSELAERENQLATH